MGAHTSRAITDPVHAHGAWVYLFCAIGSGVLVGAEGRIEPALLVATAFAGTFLAGGALAHGVRRHLRRLVGGSILALLCGAASLLVGADPRFLVVAASAAVPCALTIVLARTLGALSPFTLVAGVGTLAMAGPAAAVAGGATLHESAVLLALLWPFFAWRSLDVARPLTSGEPWDVTALRRRGLREAGLAALYTLIAVVLIQVP
jgi:hypothetical protein